MICDDLISTQMGIKRKYNCYAWKIKLPTNTVARVIFQIATLLSNNNIFSLYPDRKVVSICTEHQNVS